MLLEQSWTPDLDMEILRFSNLFGCFMGVANEKNRIVRNMIIFVIDMCKKVQSVDLKNQNILQFFCVSVKLIVDFLTNGW